MSEAALVAPQLPGRSIQEAARELAVGNIDAATEIVDGILRTEPADLSAQLLLGLIAWRMGDLAGALGAVKAICDVAPNNGTYVEVLAVLYAQAGDLHESLFHGKVATALGLDEAAASLLPPDFPSFGAAFLAIDDRPFYENGLVQRNEGNLDRALTAFGQHVALNPNDADAVVQLLDLQLRLGKIPEALAVTEHLNLSGNAQLISLVASVFAAAGLRETSSHLHQRAVSLDGDDAWILGRQIHDAGQCGAVAEASALYRDWISRFCPPKVPRRGLSAPDADLRVGFIMHDVDPEKAPAVTAIARALDRTCVQIYGYGFGELNWQINEAVRGAFDHWRNVSMIDAPALTRIIEREQLDVIIDASGMAFPRGVLALAQSNVPLKLAVRDGGADIAAPYDLILVPHQAAISNGLAMGAADLPLPRQQVQPAGLGAVREQFTIGADLRASQLTDLMLALIKELLMAIPDCQLSLRDRNIRQAVTANSLIEFLGAELAGRIDIVADSENQSFYRGVDVVLAPLHGNSHSVVDALAAGVPVLAMADKNVSPAWGPEIVRNLGLGGIVADSAAGLVQQAAALAQDRQHCRRLGVQAHERAVEGAFEPKHAAAAIMQLVRSTRENRNG